MYDSCWACIVWIIRLCSAIIYKGPRHHHFELISFSQQRCCVVHIHNIKHINFGASISYILDLSAYSIKLLLLRAAACLKRITIQKLQHFLAPSPSTILQNRCRLKINGFVRRVYINSLYVVYHIRLQFATAAYLQQARM
jgi:hypothetical protein